MNRLLTKVCSSASVTKDKKEELMKLVIGEDKSDLAE